MAVAAVTPEVGGSPATAASRRRHRQPARVGERVRGARDRSRRIDPPGRTRRARHRASRRPGSRDSTSAGRSTCGCRWTRVRSTDRTAPARRSGRSAACAPADPRGQAQTSVNAAAPTGGAAAVLPYTGLGPETASAMGRLGTLLPAAAGAVFIIACANVAAFLLSRASARARETAVRVALGAGRRQLGRQLLADSLVLSLAGGAAGMLLAFWTAQIIPALFFEEDAAHLVFAPDLAGIVAATAACAVVTVVCGLLPLFEIRDDDPARVLRRESGGPSPAMQRVRSALVVAEMACCCLLVISSALLLAGFRAALATSTGSRLGNPILATVKAKAGFGRPDLGLQYFHDAERAALALPAIHEAAWAGTLPGGRASWQSIRVEPPPVRVRKAVDDDRPVHAGDAHARRDAAACRANVRRRRHAGRVPRGARQQGGGGRILRRKCRRAIDRRSRRTPRRDHWRRDGARRREAARPTACHLLLRAAGRTFTGSGWPGDVPRADLSAAGNPGRARRERGVAQLFQRAGGEADRRAHLCRRARAARLPRRDDQRRGGRALLRRSRGRRRGHRPRRHPHHHRRRRPLDATACRAASRGAGDVSATLAGLSAAHDAAARRERNQ